MIGDFLTFNSLASVPVATHTRFNNSQRSLLLARSIILFSTRYYYCSVLLPDREKPYPTSSVRHVPSHQRATCSVSMGETSFMERGPYVCADRRQSASLYAYASVGESDFLSRRLPMFFSRFISMLAQYRGRFLSVRFS